MLHVWACTHAPARAHTHTHSHTHTYKHNQIPQITKITNTTLEESRRVDADPFHLPLKTDFFFSQETKGGGLVRAGTPKLCGLETWEAWFPYQTWRISWSEPALKWQKGPGAPGILVFPAISGVEKSLRGKRTQAVISQRENKQTNLYLGEGRWARFLL